MNDFPIEILLLLVIVIIIGLVVWIVSALIRAPGRKTAAPEETPVAARRVPPDVLTVRVSDQGIWEVLVYGVPYRTLEAVPDAAAQQKVVDALKILAGFSRTHIQRRRTEAPGGESVTGLDTTDGLPPVAAPLLRETGPLRTPASIPTFMPQINLAKEIGQIVEDLQVRMPSLARHSIRLQNAAGGGVLFFVDGQLYQNLEDIPNLEIQALIRAATKQWERQ